MFPPESNPTYQSKSLDHLGLIAGMYDELGIGNVIDESIEQDNEKRTVSLGQAVKAMVLNGLGFTQRALYLTPSFFEDKPVSRLIGEGVEASHLNDDVLGRALDKVYAYGADALYVLIASQSVKRLGLSSQVGHLDSTSIHVDGEYASDEEPGVIKLVKGYSRDHRPALNQVVLQLITEGEAGIPLIMQSLSGNSNDQTAFRETLQDFKSQLRTDFGVEYIVADSALYNAKGLQQLGGTAWLTRVPETLNLAQDLIGTIAPELMENSDSQSMRSVWVSYAGVQQRWVVVYSPQARHRAVNTLERQALKQTASEMARFDKLCRHEFKCEADAQQALETFENSLKMSALFDTQVSPIAHFDAPGRPRAGAQPDLITWQISAQIASLPEVYQQRLQRKSCFILATNQLEHTPEADLLAAYKGQQKVERGFRFLKDPMFMASTLFLKSPKRIMALMMIMTVCLLVYAVLEYRIRQALQEHQQSFPLQNGKTSDKPTARWVFMAFRGIHLLTIDTSQQLILNLKQEHLELVNILGERYQNLYSNQTSEVCGM